MGAVCVSEGRFREIASQRDEDIDLAEASLLIASIAQSDVDVDHWLSRMEALADGAAPRVAAAEGPRGRLEALCRFLHDEQGYVGNERDYYDPRNSFLDKVLERRIGIPITLSVIYLEVARRLGVPLVGVGFPAHFLTKHRASGSLFVDAFHGEVLGRDEVQDLFQRLAGEQAPFRESVVAEVSPRQILLRMLRNLKTIHRDRDESMRLIRTIDLMLILDPNQPDEYLQRGAAYLHIDADAFAIADLEHYLKIVDDPVGQRRVQRAIAKVKTRGRFLLN